jgi:hypothetical protein
MARPNFFIIGASKCGTTSVCHLLAQHPDVFVVECKEPMFFSWDHKYAKGVVWYESLFEEGAHQRWRCDASNTYTMKEVYPEALPRMLDYLTEQERREVKLLYLVRHPIKRTESYWIEKRSHGGEDVHYDFNTSMSQDRAALVDSSNYWSQLQAFFEHFEPAQIHIGFFEDFIKDPQRFMAEVFRFLDVDPNLALRHTGDNPNPAENKRVPQPTLSKLRRIPGWYLAAKLIPFGLRDRVKKKLFFKPVQGKPQWNPAVKRQVLDILRDDTRKLLEYAGKPADYWKMD